MGVRQVGHSGNCAMAVSMYWRMHSRWRRSQRDTSKPREEVRTQKMCLHEAVLTASSASSRQRRHVKMSSGLSPGA